MSTRRGASTQTSKSIPFPPMTDHFVATTVDAALHETRNRFINTITPVTTTLNGSYLISPTGTSSFYLTGTDSGFKVYLPNATQSFRGILISIYNSSTSPVTVYDYDGNLKSTLLPGDVARSVLVEKLTTAGIWVINVIASVASGVQAYNSTSDTVFSTTATTDTLITGFSVTPQQGTYGVWLSADIVIATNNRVADVVIYKNESAVENSRRQVQGVSSLFNSAFNTIAIIQVNGSDAISGRVRMDSSSTLSVYSRSLLLIRLGQ